MLNHGSDWTYLGQLCFEVGIATSPSRWSSMPIGPDSRCQSHLIYLRMRQKDLVVLISCSPSQAPIPLLASKLPRSNWQDHLNHHAGRRRKQERPPAVHAGSSLWPMQAPSQHGRASINATYNNFTFYACRVLGPIQHFDSNRFRSTLYSYHNPRSESSTPSLEPRTREFNYLLYMNPSASMSCSVAERPSTTCLGHFPM